jgi:uncharacterized membrane protein
MKPFGSNIVYLTRLSINNKNYLIMKKNMGYTDKLIRIIIAAIIVGLYFAKVLTGTVGIVLLVIALIFVLTSVVSFCPMYMILGWRTNAKEEESGKVKG